MFFWGSPKSQLYIDRSEHFLLNYGTDAQLSGKLSQLIHLLAHFLLNLAQLMPEGEPIDAKPEPITVYKPHTNGHLSRFHLRIIPQPS
jgi:hypothetical protein